MIDDVPPPLEDAHTGKLDYGDAKSYGGVLEVKEKQAATLGLKRGFFNVKQSGAVSTASSSSSAPSVSKSPLVLDEVQEAMKKANQKLQESQSEWLTGSLLKKLENDTELKPFLNDPQFMHVFQTSLGDPQSLNAFVQQNPKWQKPVQRIFAILAEHMEELGREQELKALPKHERELVERVTKDDQVKSILADKEVINFLNTLRTDPIKGQMLLMQSNQSFKGKIRKLQEIGLLQFQS